MSKVNQTIVLTAVLLATITLAAFYIHETDPETAQNRLLFNIKQELETPETATFLGVKQYELINTTLTVYTWKQNNTLYEAQLNEENTILETAVYQHNETIISMTPVLAKTLAEQLLIMETDYPPGSRFLSEPSFRLHKFDDRGPRWIVEWGLHSGNYTISNVGFTVYVFTETGKTVIADNDFEEITDIPDFDPPIISEGEATQLAMKYYSESMDCTIIESTKNDGLEVSSGDIFIEDPFRLFWSVYVSGMGQKDGIPTKRSPMFMVDAYNGELLASYYISWGMDTINWRRNNHPYYGSMYPRIISNTPHDYKLPLSEEKVRSVLAETVYQHGFCLNNTFLVKVYNETKLANDYAWDSIIVELIDGKPVIAGYWANAYDWVKTGTVLPVEDIQGFIDSEDILEGFFVVLDPETREILHQYNSTSIGVPSNNLNITREQAINITANSPFADPEGKIIEPDTLVSAEPRIIKPDWIKQLANSGNIRRLYIADMNQTDSRIYWVVKYEKIPEAHGGFTGTYLVDAETGDIVLALEDYPLVQFLMRGYAPDQLKFNGSGVVSFNVTVKAEPTLEAELPVSIEAVNLPENVTIIIDNPVRQLSTGKDAIFNVTARVGELAEIGLHNIRFEISYLDKITSAYTKFEITKTMSAFNVEPRKPVFRIGEVIAFDIRSPSPQTGANITITNPQGDIVWIMKLSEGWIDIGESWVLPYYQQVSNKELMVLREEHSLGNWTWTYRYQNITVNGGFTIKEYKEYPFGEISEMGGYPTIKDDISDVALIAVPAIESQAQPIYSEHESGPGPAVARDSANSNPFWVPVITTIIVAAFVYLRNRKR